MGAGPLAVNELGSPGLWLRVARRLQAVHPYEGVALGLGLRPWTVRAVIFVPNQILRMDAFQVGAKDVLRSLGLASKCGLKPTLWLHTHPTGSARPSQADFRGMMHGGVHLWPGSWLGVLQVEADLSGEIALARPLGSRWMAWMGDFERFRRQGLCALRGTVPA